MFKHSYMPQSMINSIIVQLVKNKCGNLTDKNNYRPIALSSITSKVFEHIILTFLMSEKSQAVLLHLQLSYANRQSALQ